MPPLPPVRPREDARLTARSARARRRLAIALCGLMLGFLAAGLAIVQATLDGPPRGFPGAAAALAAEPLAPLIPPATPVVKPTPAQLDAARRFAKGRAGVVSFAVTDTAGRVSGLRRARRHWSASVVKAMLMVAYLERQKGALTASDRALLSPMIRRSDNGTATAIYLMVGNAGLNRVARRADMKHFTPSAQWGGSIITAEDQARFFRRIDTLVPARYRSYARRLLNSIVSWQRWGIAAAKPGNWKILFKGGWRNGHGGRIVNQVAKLENGKRTITIAVLTDGNPSHDYGTRTIRGVASRLLR